MDNEIFNKEFDDFLKKRYENHTIEPDRALWEKINARLYHKKFDKSFRKVRQLIVAITSLALILVATFIYFELKTEKYQPETKPISETTKTTVAPNELLVPKQNNNTQEKNSDTLDKVSVFTSDRTSLESNERKTKKIESTVRLKKESNRLPPLLKQAPDSIKISNYKYGIFKRNAVDNKMYPDRLSIIIPKPFLSDLSIILNPGINESLILRRNVAKEFSRVSQKQAKENPKIPGPYQSFSQSTGSDIKRSKLRHLPFFIQGFVSPEISYRALVVNTQYSIPDYGKTYFNKKEKADFTFSAGVSGGIGITEKIVLQSGAFYSRYSIKFKTEAIYLLNTGGDGNLIYTSSGPVNLTLISSDSLSKESLIKSYLNFSYLSIPLTTEIHFLNNYFINIGLNFNMLIGQNLNWKAENYDGNFSDAISNPIDGLAASSISMIVGLGAEKPLTHNLSIIVNPSLKLHLSSMNNRAPVKSYPYAWGLNFGLRYYFN